MTQIAVKMQLPERAIVAHWFNPAHIIPVVEVVPGQQTSEETTQSTIGLLKRIGKLPVRLRIEIAGFLVNRIQIAIAREVWDMMERGIASAEDIDLAVRGSMGLRLAAIGPLQVADFAGLDVYDRVYANLVPDIRSDTQVPDVVRELVDQGHFGVKTGKGFFDYTPESIAEKREQRDRQFLALVKLLYGNVPG